MNQQFIQWVTEHPVANPAAAWSAWQAQQTTIDLLRSQIMYLQDSLKHQQQRQFEASQKEIRLVYSA